MSIVQFFCLYFLFFLPIALSGCGDSPPEAPPAAPSAKKVPTERIPVRIAINSTLKSTPLIIAQRHGFFEEQGLIADMEVKQSGADTLKALHEGRVELATMPEILAAADTLKHDNWQILASVNRSNTTLLIGRRDHGITDIADLAGKKIAIKVKSGSSYWLSKFLVYNAISAKDITLVDAPPKEIVRLVTEGETDAAITWHPHAYKILQNLGDNAISFSAQQDQEMYWLLAGERDWLSRHPEAAQGIIRALVQAEEFIASNPSRTKKEVADYLDLNLEYVDFEWPLHKFLVELSQNLYLTMEDEVRWKANRSSASITPPDLANFFFFDALSAVRPDAVDIVH